MSVGPPPAVVHGRTIALCAVMLALAPAACTTHQRRRALETPLHEEVEAASVSPRILCDFSAPEQIDDWRVYRLEGIFFTPEETRLEGFLRLRAEEGAGTYYYPCRFDPAGEPLLAWRWRVSEVFGNSSPLTPELANFPARVLVGFDYGWQDAGEAALQWKRETERITGMPPPGRALCYTFGGELAPSEAVDSLFGQGRIVEINLRPSTSEPGKWHEELRDVAADYAAVFGETAPPVVCIAAGVDCQRVKRSVASDFDDFRVWPAAARAQFAQKLGQGRVEERQSSPLSLLLAALAAVLACGLGGLGIALLRRRARGSGDG